MNTNATITGAYDYIQSEATGHIGLSAGSSNANIYLTQTGNTQVKISSTLFDDGYFNLDVNFKPTSVSVSNGHSGYTYVGDVWPTASSHYIKMTIGGNHYYLDCQGL